MKRLAKPAAGITAIKLTIAIALVAVLATVALPSYKAYVMRSHRANARAALLQAAQWMERTATSQGRYPLTAAIPAGVLLVEGGHYTINAASNNGLTYTLTALPTATQATDRCGAYQINEVGTRLQVKTDQVPSPLGPLKCWGR